jgi:hypothetical protein
MTAGGRTTKQGASSLGDYSSSTLATKTHMLLKLEMHEDVHNYSKFEQ